MSDKPKRTLTEEQKEKMRAGREKAMAERKKVAEKEAKEKKKKEQEEKREQKRKEKIIKEDEKKKQLDAELQALQQEKDRIEVTKKTRENRDKFRDKLKKDNIEMSFDDLNPDEEIPEEWRQEEESPTSPQASPVPTDEEKLFYEKVHDIAQQQRPEVAKVFRNLTSGYDREKDITNNLQAMIADVKAVIKKNVEEIKSTKKVVDKEEEKPEVISRKEEEVKEQKKYVSQLHTLMRLR